jgi:hypothetical protein
LLFYPGGLSALGFLAICKLRDWPQGAPSLGQVFACVPPLLALSLFPLPGAAALARHIDLPLALALLEWPQVLALAAAYEAAPTDASRRVQELGWGYGLLLLGAAALAAGGGSLALDGIALGPPHTMLPQAIFCAGAVGWGLALPPLLGWGAFQAAPAPRWDLGLRALGHVLAASLPWLWLPLPWLPLPLVLLALICGIATRSRPASRHVWKAVIGCAAIILLGLLLASAATGLLAKVRFFNP